MKSVFAIAALSLFAATTGSVTAKELIVNGNFEDVKTPGYAAQLAIHDILHDQEKTATALGEGGSLSQGVQVVTGWQTDGYNFLMTPGSATSGGAGTSWNDHITFWDGITAIPSTSPLGGNFIALDAAYYMDASHYQEQWPVPVDLVLPIWQEVQDLEVGQEYELSFYWAAAQQHGFDGDTWEFLTVSFGEESFTTDQIELAEHDFSGWMQQTVRFTASSTTQILSFLAGGGPNGQPPFVFLDGVSMKAVPEAIPEPGTVALLVLGVSGLALMRNRFSGRNRK